MPSFTLSPFHPPRCNAVLGRAWRFPICERADCRASYEIAADYSRYTRLQLLRDSRRKLHRPTVGDHCHRRDYPHRTAGRIATDLAYTETFTTDLSQRQDEVLDDKLFWH